MNSVLVTGGTGLLGRRVARALAAEGHRARLLRPGPAGPPARRGVRARAAGGHPVRILSRSPAAPPVPRAEVVVGDLSTGAGLPQAVAGASAVVHCATDPRNPRAVDVEGTERLLAAAREAGRPHLGHGSIGRLDRIARAGG